MDESEVKKQLSQMVSFILQEAQEKATEIDAKAKEEFSIEKSRIVQVEKLQIMKEFEVKEKQAEVAKKISYSNALNQSRLTILKAREDSLQRILSTAQSKIAEMGQPSAEYNKLLERLIVQALVKLSEVNVRIVCRKEDIAVVQESLARCVEEASTFLKKTIVAEVESNFHLPPPYTPGSLDFCNGGVIVSAMSGRIICTNTLDARLALAYEGLLPQIRSILFGANENRKFFD